MTVLLRLEEQQHVISEFKSMDIFCLFTFKWKSKLTVRSLC